MAKLSDFELEKFANKLSETRSVNIIADIAQDLLSTRKELAALREAVRFIHVSERLPETLPDNVVSDSVIVCALVYGIPHVLNVSHTYLSKDWEAGGWLYKAGWYAPECSYPTEHIITHWQPLPPAPEVS